MDENKEFKTVAEWEKAKKWRNMELIGIPFTKRVFKFPFFYAEVFVVYFIVIKVKRTGSYQNEDGPLEELEIISLEERQTRHLKRSPRIVPPDWTTRIQRPYVEHFPFR